MTAFRLFPALAAASLAATPAVAQTDLPCLQQRQAEDLVIFVLPTVVDVAGSACAAVLPPGSHLASGAGARYRTESEAAWPNARDTFGGSNRGIGSLLGEEGLRSMMTGAVAKEARRILKPESCAAVDRVLGGLGMLPARNVAQILIGMVQLSRADQRLPIKLCPSLPVAPPPEARAPR